jgi:hypothetical protein
MLEKVRQILARSWQHIEESATEYDAVSYTSAVYRTSRPFKGLHVGTAGDIEIEDLRGKKTIIPDVGPGPVPYAGKAIHEGNTTATGITALF